MALQDPQLLKARPREQWRPGSAIEVCVFDSKWCVGYIVTQDHGVFIIFMSDSLSFRHVPRGDSSLAPIGRHVRELPPGWEVRAGSPPHIAPVGARLGRTCYTLEDAWALHMEQVYSKAAKPRSEASPTLLQGSPASSPQPAAVVKPIASNGFPYQVQPELLADVTSLDREELISRLREADARLEELQRHNFQLREERDMAQRRLEEARAEITRLHGLSHRSVSQSSLPTSPSQRVLVTSPQPLQPSNSSGFIKSEAAACPPVPNSWQPPTSARETPGRSAVSPVSGGDGDGEEGDMFPGPDFNCNNFRSTQPLATMASVPAAAPPPSRMSEKPVEIVVSVPRASVDEIEAPPPVLVPHPCRSLQSLQKNTHVPLVPHQVTRLPSAPAPQSQAFAGAPVQVACANAGYAHHHHIARGLLPSGLLPSAPASLAAPAGGRVVRPISQVAKAPPIVTQQACMTGYR